MEEIEGEGIYGWDYKQVHAVGVTDAIKSLFVWVDPAGEVWAEVDFDWLGDPDALNGMDQYLAWQERDGRPRLVVEARTAFPALVSSRFTPLVGVRLAEATMRAVGVMGRTAKE